MPTPQANTIDAPLKRIIARILKNSHLFSQLSESILLEMANYCAVSHHTKADIIFDIGQTVDSLYVIGEGQVIIERQQGSDFQEVAQFTIGESFGESGLFVQGSIRRARATARGPVQLISFPSSSAGLSALTEQAPQLLTYILRTLIVHASSRIRSINRLISKNSQVVQELWKQLMIDKLMKIYNMSYFEYELSKKLEQYSCYTISMIKPRNFKKINDICGHDIGDATLSFVGRTLINELGKKKNRYSIRFAGNECALVSCDYMPREAEALTTEILDILQGLDLSRVDTRINFPLSYQQAHVHWPRVKGTPATLLQEAHKKLMMVFSREK